MQHNLTQGDHPKLSNQYYIMMTVCFVCVQNGFAILQALYGQYFLAYPDSYMRMVKVYALLTHHQWFNHFVSSTNTPYGADFHCWTRALDILLISGTSALSFFMPMKEALWLWSFVLPPLLKICAGLLLCWAFKPLQQFQWQKLFVLVAFLANPYIQTIYLPLRVDYNFLTITLFIAYVGLFFRAESRKGKQSSIAMGVLFGFGSWISLSFYIVGLIPIAIWIGYWMCQTSRSHNQIHYFFYSAIGCILACLLIENATVLSYEYDILSLYYLLIIFMLAMSYGICEKFTSVIHQRIVLFFILLTTMSAILLYFQPKLMLGPYAAASPYWRKWIFPQIIEHISIFKFNAVYVLSLLFNLVFGVAALGYLKLKRTGVFVDNSLLLLLIPLTFLACHMLRWNDYAQPIFILAAAYALLPLHDFFVNKKFASANIIMYLVIIALTLSLIPFIISSLIPTKTTSSERMHCISQMLQFVASDEFINQPQLRLAVEPELAPVVQFYSHHQVLGGFYHPNDQGLKATFEFEQGTESKIKNIASKRQLNGFLLCQSQHSSQNSMLNLVRQRKKISFLEPFNKRRQYPFYFYRIKHF